MTQQLDLFRAPRRPPRRNEKTMWVYDAGEDSGGREIIREEADTALLLAAVWRLTRGDDPIPDMTPAPIIAAGCMSLVFKMTRKAYGGEIYQVVLSCESARRVLLRFGLTLDEGRERLLDILLPEGDAS